MSINLVILWHMHQPYYRHPGTGEYELPWVRLHCAKDYVDMPSVSAQVEGVAVNFNLVPGLLEQIEDYAENRVVDLFEAWSLRADDLEAEEAERVYDLLGLPLPRALLEPIVAAGQQRSTVRVPRTHFRPIIDGEISHYWEWLDGGELEITTSGGSMHQSAGQPPLTNLRFGDDRACLYLLFCGNGTPLSDLLAEGSCLTVEWLQPQRRRLQLSAGPDGSGIDIRWEMPASRTWRQHPTTGIEAALSSCLEVACPLQLLGVGAGDQLCFRLILTRPHGKSWTYPEQDLLRIVIASHDPRAKNWLV